MEWCGKLYEEWRSEENLHRLERTVLVLIVFVMAAGWVWDTGVGIPGMDREYAGYLPETEIETKPVSAAPEILPAAEASGCSPAPAELLDMSRDAAGQETVTQKITTAITSKGLATGAETFPAEPEYPAGSVPPISIPKEEVPTETVPPADATEEEAPENTVPAAVGGFLVDEHGMICGIEEPAVVSDGYLILPSEGCTGIAAGAFADAPVDITEIYIPANIMYIEEGAFAGLGYLEWLEAEASDSYYTEDGVLFSENGTCILGFPSARTGDYKVPDRVTRFAEGAFADAKIEIIDAVGCSLGDTGSLPSSVLLLRAEDLQG